MAQEKELLVDGMLSSDELNNFISTFQGISLSDLNKKAKMLDRSENKYIFSVDDLFTVLEDLLAEFDILDMHGKRIFTYETVYFDDENQVCYHQHHQGKRLRFKIRTRKYIDAELCFFEIKLKGLRGKTNKKRFKCDISEHGILTEKAQEFVVKSFKELYGKNFNYQLTPSNKMSYNRITLVAKKGGERMTIDYDLTFSECGKDDIVKVPKDFIIVETKSARGNGIADRIFKKYRHRSTNCSKFCLSKILLCQVSRHNRFKPLLRKYLPRILEGDC